MTTAAVPNHHAGHGGFAGPLGWLFALTMGHGRNDVARWASDVTELGPGVDLVDIGCGPGRACRIAAERGARVIGVDPAGPMLKMARMTTSSHDVTYVEGAAERLPLDDASADVVWSMASIHHWPDLEAGLREARRVLRADGRFLGIETHVEPGATGLHSHGWTDDQAAAFADACTAAGFTRTAIKTHRADKREWMAVLAYV